MIPQPPKTALKFLRWFCKSDYLEEIEGDLIELYELQFVSSSVKAKLFFIWRVFLSFRPAFIRSIPILKHSNIKSMLQHNILISYRNFKKYKSSFLINLIGLSSGLACVLFIWLWVDDELSVDKFHSKDARLYQVLENVKQADGIITRKTTPGVMSQTLLEEMPEVINAVTTTMLLGSEYLLSVGDNNLRMTGIFSDHAFFEMFSFKLVEGNPSSVFQDKKSIVISEKLAAALFKENESAIGKMIEWEHNRQYIVSGVMEDLPSNASEKFDFVLSFEHFRDNNSWIRNWFNTYPQTYVQLEEGTDIDLFNSKIADLVKNKTENKATHRIPFVTAFSDFYLYGQYKNGKQAGGRIDYVKLFSLIAVFILIIACINFMNLSTARASRRLKEVGVKKAMGAQRKSLIFQFLSESVITVLLSSIVALFLVAIFLPSFNNITNKQLVLELAPRFTFVLSGILILTGLLAGIYPAIYLSGFNPIMIIKGKMNNQSKEKWIRQGLVVFQFSLSIILIVSVLVVYKQIEFTQTENMGYKNENVLIVQKTGKLNNSDKLKLFKTEVMALQEVTAASVSNHTLSGNNGGTYGFTWPGKDPEDRTEFERVSVDYGFIELLDIQLVAGRPFSESFGSDSSKIMLNQAAIDYMQMEDPVGKSVKLWGDDREIIGVTENFHFASFKDEVTPLFLFLAPESSDNILIKLEKGKEKLAIEKIEALHAAINDGFLFDSYFLDTNYNVLYESEKRVSILSAYFAGLAIIISALGLVGLAAFTAERRLKEISIRKILGSGEFNIVLLLARDFTKMVIISIVIALPISYFFTKEWLNSYAYRIDLSWWFFAGAGIFVLAIAWITVGVQTIKTSKVNPVDCLKSE